MIRVGRCLDLLCLCGAEKYISALAEIVAGCTTYYEVCKMIYKCGCEANGDNVANYCPMHGDAALPTGSLTVVSGISLQGSFHRDVVITEGVESHFLYHLSDPRKTTRGLCGKPTMTTLVPLSAWGVVTHLKERYCETCATIAKDASSLSGIKVVHCMKEPYTVYIGRRNPRKGLPQSKWANPFVIGKDGDRDAVLRKYRDYVPTQPHLVAALHELEGQVLGCWCLDKPVSYVREVKECHGEILMEMVETLKRQEVMGSCQKQ